MQVGEHFIYEGEMVWAQSRCCKISGEAAGLGGGRGEVLEWADGGWILVPPPALPNHWHLIWKMTEYPSLADPQNCLGSFNDMDSLVSARSRDLETLGKAQDLCSYKALRVILMTSQI